MTGCRRRYVRRRGQGDETGDASYGQAFRSLIGIHLEDSWVLDLTASSTALVFTLDVVLTPAHPDYRPPVPDQARCYRRATLWLESDTAVCFRRSSCLPRSMLSASGITAISTSSGPPRR